MMANINSIHHRHYPSLYLNVLDVVYRPPKLKHQAWWGELEISKKNEQLIFFLFLDLGKGEK